MLITGVRWMQFPNKELREPFFHQTVARLRRAEPPALEFDTEAEALLALANELPPITPAGLIFHVSRCGSTLVCNALRTGRARILSEAAPLSRLLGPYASTVWPYPLHSWG